MTISVQPLLLLLIGLLCLSHPLCRLAQADDDSQCSLSNDGGCAASGGGAKEGAVGGEEGVKVIEEVSESEEFGVYVTDVEDPPYVDEFAAAEAEAAAGKAAAEDEKTEDTGPSDVVALDAATYNETVESKEYVMVEFYAPWCGHCKQLAPHYKELASSVKQVYGDKVVIAKVDTAVEKDLATANKISGLPTIFWFEKGEKVATYSGVRTADTMFTWIKKKLGDAVEIVSSKDDAAAVVEKSEVLVVGYFESLSGGAWEAFKEAARLEDSTGFVATDSAETAAAFGITFKAPAVAFLKKEGEDKITLYEESEFTVEAVKKFAFRNRFELYYKFAQASVPKIFQSGINKQLLFFLTKDQEAEYLPMFKKAAKSVQGEVVFVHVDIEDSEVASVMQYFGFQGKEVKLFGFSTEDKTSRTYNFDKEMVLENVAAFAKDFAAGKVAPVPLSQKVPEENPGPVKVVVGKNFDDIVLDASKDVFLFVYTPGGDCPACDDLIPIIEALGKRFKAVKSVVVAKMDGTHNEHARIGAEKRPLLALFKAGDKSAEPVVYDGESDITSLTKFLKDNVSIPFRLVKKVKEAAAAPAAEEAKDEL